MKNVQVLRTILVFFLLIYPLSAAGLQFKSSSFTTEENVKTLRLYDYTWISLNDFIDKFGSELTIDADNYILRGKLQNKTLQIYGGSMFFRVNSVLYHLPTTVEIVGNDYFIPVGEFLKILQAHFYTKIYYKEMENVYILEPTDFSISHIEIKEFKNGSMVRIYTNKTFLKKHCSLWEGTNNNGWLYFTVYGGTCDTTLLKQSYPSGMIRYVEPIQSESSVQFSFKLRHSITGSEFYIESNPSSIVTL